MSGKPSKTGNDKVNKGGQISRQTLYSIAQTYSREAIETLAIMMRSAKQDSVRMGASKALLDKALPDLKAMEVTGREGEDLKLIVKIVEDKHE